MPFTSTDGVLQEIASYTSRLLLEPKDAEGQAHAWQELQPYLPIPHASIATEVDTVRQTLAPFVRNGRWSCARRPPEVVRAAWHKRALNSGPHN